ncbi:hypothetical protein H2200_010548 [Cladophialophora chaetospira]|uniref:Uncharacterized protein n=1 Tax=Cladophialophora chaetospira TaxID=386627 RepID=A0AA38X1R0_9EURO|nr:hypothetical protein H2200_010548 [Cladophialophora chaetospira]
MDPSEVVKHASTKLLSQFRGWETNEVGHGAWKREISHQRITAAPEGPPSPVDLDASASAKFGVIKDCMAKHRANEHLRVFKQGRFEIVVDAIDETEIRLYPTGKLPDNMMTMEE